MTSIKTLVAVALVALLVPVAAVAKETTIEGPQTLGGRGHFGGEIQMANGEGQRPVVLVGRIGYVGFLDLGGDLRVSCAGKGRVVTEKTEQGAVYLCRGSGRALVKGSHFKLRGFARVYRVRFPEGARGIFNQAGRNMEREGEEPEERQAPERRQSPGGSEREKIPTVQELAALLAAKDAG